MGIPCGCAGRAAGQRAGLPAPAYVAVMHVGRAGGRQRRARPHAGIPARRIASRADQRSPSQCSGDAAAGGAAARALPGIVTGQQRSQ